MIANAKRTILEKENVHSWHPYYAGYSESFVSSVIDEEIGRLSSESLIFDPWIGSGTTGVVCQKRGFNCIGVDINKSMALFAASKTQEVLKLLTLDNEKTLNQIISLAKKTRKKIDTSHLSEIMSYDFSYKILRLLFSIENYFDEKYSIDNYLNPLQSFFKSVLLITNRELMGYVRGSNPTWFKKTEPKQSISFKKLENKFRDNYYRMFNDLKTCFDSCNYSSFNVLEGSSNNLFIDNNVIDLVITSPPYLTRIDYAVSTQVELLILSGEIGYREIRNNTIGTTTIYSQRKVGSECWGGLCNKIIDYINNHGSYSSQDYYIKNTVQYFDSTYNSLKELYRVMKKGASAYLVIQNSYYKEIEIKLPDIYLEMATNIGFYDAISMRKDEVRTTMASINSRSKKYNKDKVYYEEIIRIIK